MPGHCILKSIVLGPHHLATGKTRHYQDEQELPQASSLKIAAYEGTEGFYLLYLDANDNELIDTFHNTIDEAFAQAEWEYNVRPDEWETANIAN